MSTTITTTRLSLILLPVSHPRRPLTYGCDDSDGVEQCPGEGPLHLGVAVLAVPAMLRGGRIHTLSVVGEQRVGHSRPVVLEEHVHFDRHVPQSLYMPAPSCHNAQLELLLSLGLKLAENEAAHDRVGDHEGRQADGREEEGDETLAARRTFLAAILRHILLRRQLDGGV